MERTMTTRERMEMAMERWKAAERVSMAAELDVWKGAPSDPARDALRARYADALKAEGEAAAEYRDLVNQVVRQRAQTVQAFVAAVAAHRNG